MDSCAIGLNYELYSMERKAHKKQKNITDN
jgi:hypothetical protein